MREHVAFEGFDEDLLPDTKEEHPALPQKLIQGMLKQGVISATVGPEQTLQLRLLEWAYQDPNKFFLRFQLANTRKRDREMLVMFPLLTRPERWVLSLFLNAAKEKESGEKVKGPRKNTSIKNVQKMVLDIYKFEMPEVKVKQLRQTAYDYKRERSSYEKRSALESFLP
jgi:hypothetical protein